MENTGLDPDDIERIKHIFSKYPEIERVLLYGSRAMGSYRPSSDIDLTLVGKDISAKHLQAIEFSLDDLMLPNKFDISIFHKISNPEFVGHIKRKGIEFYRRKS